MRTKWYGQAEPGRRWKMNGVWIANHIKHSWTKDKMENAKSTQVDRTKRKDKRTSKKKGKKQP